jgi:hypothetical protein
MIPADLDLLQPNRARLRVPGIVAHLLDIVSCRFASGKPFFTMCRPSPPQFLDADEPPATSSRRRRLLLVRPDEAHPTRSSSLPEAPPNVPARPCRLVVGHRRPTRHLFLSSTFRAPRKVGHIDRHMSAGPPRQPLRLASLPVRKSLPDLDLGFCEKAPLHVCSSTRGPCLLFFFSKPPARLGKQPGPSAASAAPSAPGPTC